MKKRATIRFEAVWCASDGALLDREPTTNASPTDAVAPLNALHLQTPNDLEPVRTFHGNHDQLS
jgi:hypothetical protein